ncbi:hypothetical protein C0995_007842 [Termitomyces sp. Mi166|nr:hypothetical protein C0995_007842 [Termitomyces sp. Mi166\
MNLEYFARIGLYNANPITLLGRGIQCIYEGSFAWIAIATHPLFADDYYMEKDDNPGPLSTYLPPPLVLQSPFPQQKLDTPSAVFSSSPPDVTLLPTPDPSPYVASLPSMTSAALLSPAPPVAAEPNIATLTLMTPDVNTPSEKPLVDHEMETRDDPAFLQYWRTSKMENSSPVPDTATEPPAITSSTVSTLMTPLSTCPSEASTLPPYVPCEDETPPEEPVDLLNLPSLPLYHAPWPEQEYFLPPLTSSVLFSVDSEHPTSKPPKRRSPKLELDHILNPEPQRRTKRHSFKKEDPKKTIEELDEGPYNPSGKKSTVRFHSSAHPYRHHGHHRKPRRKDRVYDKAEADAGLEAPSPEQRDESPPPPTPHPRHRELPTVKERFYAESDEFLKRDESPPPQRLARPPTPHPRHRELPPVEERFYAECDEFLNRLEKELVQVGFALGDLKTERAKDEHNSPKDDRKKERKERRRDKKERRSAPYASQSTARSKSLFEYRDPLSTLEHDSSRNTGRKKAKRNRKRGTPESVDDIGTLGFGALSLARPQATCTEPSGSHPVQSSTGLWGLDTLTIALPELDASQQAGPSGGFLSLGSLATALPVVQQLRDGEPTDLLQGVQPSIGLESSEDQGQRSEVSLSTAQMAEGNRHRSDVEELSNTHTQVHFGNETFEQEQTETPLTIKIPSMAQLRARIAARNSGGNSPEVE